jgi:hypothetical protein
MSYHRHLGIIESNLDPGIRAADPDLVNPFSVQSCLDKGNSESSSLDAQIADKDRNWNPTGYYTQKQITDIVTATSQMLSSCADQVRAAPNSTGDAEVSRNIAIKDVQRKMQEGLHYTQGAYSNQIKGMTINDVPGLKRWVIQSMLVCSNTVVTASLLWCETPTLAAVILVIGAAIEAAWSVIRAILGVAYDIVLAAGKAVGKIGDLLPAVVTYAIYGGAALALYWLYRQVRG